MAQASSLATVTTFRSIREVESCAYSLRLPIAPRSVSLTMFENSLLDHELVNQTMTLAQPNL